MERILSQRETKFESSELFLFPLYTILFLAFSGFFLILSPFLIIIPLIPYLIFLNKLIWEWKGVEMILIDEENLIIRRKPKIFNRELVMPLREIESIEYREKTSLEKSWFAPSVSNWIMYQEKLQVHTIMDTKLPFGINLTNDERDELIDVIMEQVLKVKDEVGI